MEVKNPVSSIKKLIPFTKSYLKLQYVYCKLYTNKLQFKWNLPSPSVYTDVIWAFIWFGTAYYSSTYFETNDTVCNID